MQWPRVATSWCDFVSPVLLVLSRLELASGWFHDEMRRARLSAECWFDDDDDQVTTWKSK